MNRLPFPPTRTKVSVAEAKAKFAALSRRAEEGETIVITRHGKEIAVLGPAEQTDGAKQGLLGAWRDRKVWIAEDFDALGAEWDEYTGG